MSKVSWNPKQLFFIQIQSSKLILCPKNILRPYFPRHFEVYFYRSPQTAPSPSPLVYQGLKSNVICIIFVIFTPIVITSIKAATYTVQSSLVLNIRQIYQDMDGVIECTSCLSRRIVFIHHVISIEFCMRYMIIFLERASFH